MTRQKDYAWIKVRVRPEIRKALDLLKDYSSKVHDRTVTFTEIIERLIAEEWEACRPRRRK